MFYVIPNYITQFVRHVKSEQIFPLKSSECKKSLGYQSQFQRGKKLLSPFGSDHMHVWGQQIRIYTEKKRSTQ